MSESRTRNTRTMRRRLAQYRDRWTSYGAQTGIVAISDKPSPAELQKLEIFADYDEGFLEKISADVSLAHWREGAVLFEQGSYLDLAFFVIEGTVEVFLEGGGGLEGSQPIFDTGRTMIEPARPQPTPGEGTRMLSRTGARSGSQITFLATLDFDLPRGSGASLGPGEIFGEIGAMSGWPQAVTARTTSECRLAQIRIPALRAMKRRSSALKERVDRLYRERALLAQLKSTPLFGHSTDLFLMAIREVVELVSCDPGEVIVRQGEAVDCLYLVRSGFVKLAQTFGEGEMTVSYLSKGMTLGEVELMVEGLDGWQVTASSVEYAELVKIPARAFLDMVGGSPKIEAMVWKSVMARIKEAGYSRRDLAHAEFTQVALDRGLMQGNSMLVIDLEACTRCDDCVRACAATHEGRPRFVREGSKVENLLIARSCYHCRDPVCLVGCPTGAIHRAGAEAVVEIDDEICIGCGTCAGNCPYDAIVMHETGERWPEDMLPASLRGEERRVASKCDLCNDTGHGPACVSNCPQGCAYRVGSIEEIQRLLGGEEPER